MDEQNTDEPVVCHDGFPSFLNFSDVVVTGAKNYQFRAGDIPNSPAGNVRVMKEDPVLAQMWNRPTVADIIRGKVMDLRARADRLEQLATHAETIPEGSPLSQMLLELLYKV